MAAMRKSVWWALATLTCLLGASALRGGRAPAETQPKFQTSDRCTACHTGLKTDAGQDLSFSNDWRTSMMANSARDPYWQASVRREITDYPMARAAIENECSVCHMPIANRAANAAGRTGDVFAHLPFGANKKDNLQAQAEDGV